MRKFLILMVVVLSLIPERATAQLCFDQLQASNSASRFQLNGVDGTVTDRKTGLMWQRCLLGQTWNSQNLTCDGVYVLSNYQEGLILANDNRFAGHYTWRLPNIKELFTILETQCTFPLINTNIFKFATASNVPEILSSTLKSKDRVLKLATNFVGHSTEHYLTARFGILLVRDAR
ncbi:DUF1566 domain-containing protein [Shewanella sp. M16]|uniref:Lcl C-terminal domain-containing protein n=1 Tax=Shewanella sp. M16 TaxID=2830837 RepID=UPI001BB00C70|nr:DUF1566 domain-containing protein [Shewanella sp. M16]MBS0041138.1 DUF1566 domain-containing protein [Shewanella sp. M16]